MRPALQRLLARPSSLEILRYLVGNAQELRPAVTRTRRCSRSPFDNRQYSSAAVGPQEEAALVLGDGSPEIASPISKSSTPSRLVRKYKTGQANNQPRYSNLNYGPWNESLWTRDEIEFESNLDGEATSRPRLLDQPAHRMDVRLWACLFDYRQRLYGLSGVAMFWEAVKRGDFQVPVIGAYAQRFWEEFVNLGLQDSKVLKEVWRYADQRLEETQERWSKLYVKIIQHLLLNGRGQEAIDWHSRLIERHAPGPNGFAEMVRQVVFKRGDMEALKEIYKGNNHRNVYGKIVPFLCEQEDFKSALQWHFILLEKGDLPASSKKAEPLVHFLAIYNRRKAVQVTKSLVDAGVPFASRISSTLNDNTKISREMMNLIHGKTFHIPVKAYNDNLGARWLATQWVSLDVALNAIHALGVQEIGPLSLQAIALRERDAERITQRINQLKDLDISIGNSTFSRAVEKFARTQNQEFLDGLLKSDQHPDEFDDHNLQEQLLTSYARSRDWFQYRLTLAIRLVGSKHPEMDTQNIILRSHVNNGDTSAMLASLRKMQMDGIVVTANTVNHILHGILRPRQRGRRPITSTIKNADDLNMAISILKGIMESGSFVSATYWREIIKRLGMLGRLKELEDLCVFLASWYGPANTTSFLSPTVAKRVHRYRVPTQVKTSHPLHPLKILFPPALQQAIVEWGFMHSLKNPPRHTTEPAGLIRKADVSPPITFGISLLKRLHQYRVHININTVRKAIFNRLVTYYGPGRSNRLSNRQARKHNVLSLEEMAGQIDEALGRRTFASPYLRQVIESRGSSRLRKRLRKNAARSNAGYLKAPKQGVLNLSN